MTTPSDGAAPPPECGARRLRRTLGPDELTRLARHETRMQEDALDASARRVLRDWLAPVPLHDAAPPA
ncbi:MAG: hypothetical protein ACXW61_11985 [Gemmatirosa sp.]